MNTRRPLGLRATAKAVGVPASWLRAQAEAGRVPSLVIGRRRLFNVAAVRRAVLQLAGELPRLRLATRRTVPLDPDRERV
jgi:hypothetical protein